MMRQLYVEKPNDLKLLNVEEQMPLKDDEVKIRITYGGICGSDLRYLKGKFAHGKFPLIPGHEAVGTIVEAAEGAKYKKGTRVVILPNTYCGDCEYCMAGKTNICRSKASLGINANGAFQDYFVISSKFVLPIPEGIEDDRAVIIEPLAVVVSGFKKVNITASTKVAIIGSGTIGLLSIAYALFLNAAVTATDINPKKHLLAKQLGNVRALYPHELEDSQEKFDVVIEAAGTKESFLQAINCLKPGGSLLALGIVPDVEIPATQIIRNNQSILGSIIYEFPKDFEDTIQLLEQESFYIDPVYSKTFTLEDFKEAFALAEYGNDAKILIEFT